MLLEILNIEWSIKSDNAGVKNEMAPRQGKKNLAKFLGIDMSALALADADTDTGNSGHGPGMGPALHHDLGTLANIDTDQDPFKHFNIVTDQGLDCESVSITSSVSAGRRSQLRGGVARHILGMSIPGIKSTSRGASLEKTVMEEIPEQLRTPKVPQVGTKNTFVAVQ